MLDKITLFLNGFDQSVVDGVHQFLEYFKCCPDVYEHLDKFQKNRLEELRVEAETVTRRRGVRSAPKETMQTYRSELPKLIVVVGKCPKCGSNMVGEPVSRCESEKSGRHFYKECTACTYYSEIWKIRNKFKEMEGG